MYEIEVTLSRVERRRRKRNAVVRQWVSIGELVLSILIWFSLFCIASSLELEWYLGGYGPRYGALGGFGIICVAWGVRAVLNARYEARRVKRALLFSERLYENSLTYGAQHETLSHSEEPLGSVCIEKDAIAGVVEVRSDLPQSQPLPQVLSAPPEEAYAGLYRPAGFAGEPRLREEKIRELRQAIAAAFPELGLDTDEDDTRDNENRDADMQIQ